MMYFVTLLCVIGIATGQILFKLTAQAWAETGSIFASKTIVVLGMALVLYGITTIAWVWVLQKLDLGRAYPFMALAFVLVPIGSYFIFGEKFNLQYMIGSFLVVVGIIVAVRA